MDSVVTDLFGDVFSCTTLVVSIDILNWLSFTLMYFILFSMLQHAHDNAVSIIHKIINLSFLLRGRYIYLYLHILDHMFCLNLVKSKNINVYVNFIRGQEVNRHIHDVTMIFIHAYVLTVAFLWTQNYCNVCNFFMIWFSRT